MPLPHPSTETGDADPVSFGLFAAKVVLALVLVAAALGEAPRAGLAVPAGLVVLAGAGAAWSFLRTRRRVETLREQYLRE